MKKEKKNMTNKVVFQNKALYYAIHSLFVVTIGFIFSTNAFAVTSTSTNMEALSNFDTSVFDKNSDEEAMKQRTQILERFRGIIPNALLKALSGTSKVTTKTASSSVTSQNTEVFTKNLKLGDTDPQVLLLQKALNDDIDTIIAVTGPGSKGSETTYFGVKTKDAVIKLQNKHFGEVLAPNGLTSGTGYFGGSTRAMMNNLLKNKNKNTISKVKPETLTSTIPKATVSGLGETVTITSISPTHGKSGTVVTIHGTGITPTANKIVAGAKVIYNASSTDEKTLTFTVESPVSFQVNPKMSVASTTYLQNNFDTYKTSSFPEIRYPVCIMNDSGMSNCVFFTFDI